MNSPSPLAFELLSDVQKEQAKARFFNASPGDGYRYEVTPDGSVLCRSVKRPDMGAVSAVEEKAIAIARQVAEINALVREHQLPFGHLRVPDVGRLLGDCNEAACMAETGATV